MQDYLKYFERCHTMKISDFCNNNNFKQKQSRMAPLTRLTQSSQTSSTERNNDQG